MLYDIAVVGGGPAGLSAAIQGRTRGKSVVVISGDIRDNALYKARQVDNYLGLPQMEGAQMLAQFRDHAKALGAEWLTGRVLNVMPMGDRFFLGVGSDMAEARSVVLATGVVQAAKLPGEAEYLGRGVSYCATCDGMFYRGRTVVCAGDAPNFDEETAFLRSIGCQVIVKRLAGLSILGEDRVSGVRDAAGALTPCDGVFLLRASIAPARLAPGLELENGYIKVDARMATSLPGVYAAGDCTGQPLQLAKAVGQGQAAAHFSLERGGAPS